MPSEEIPSDIKKRQNEAKQGFIELNENAKSKDPKIQNNYNIGSREVVQNNKAVATRVIKRNRESYEIGLTNPEIKEKEIAGQRSEYNKLGASKIIHKNNEIIIKTREYNNNKIKNISSKASEGAKKRNNWIIWLKQIQLHILYLTRNQIKFPQLINDVMTSIWNRTMRCENQDVFAPLSPLYASMAFVSRDMQDINNEIKYKNFSFDIMDESYNEEKENQILQIMKLEIEKQIEELQLEDPYNNYINYLNNNKDKQYWNRFQTYIFSENELIDGVDKEEICSYFSENRLNIKSIKKRNKNRLPQIIDQQNQNGEEDYNFELFNNIEELSNDVANFVTPRTNDTSYENEQTPTPAKSPKRVQTPTPAKSPKRVQTSTPAKSPINTFADEELYNDDDEDENGDYGFDPYANDDYSEENVLDSLSIPDNNTISIGKNVIEPVVYENFIHNVKNIIDQAVVNVQNSTNNMEINEQDIVEIINEQRAENNELPEQIRNIADRAIQRIDNEVKKIKKRINNGIDVKNIKKSTRNKKRIAGERMLRKRK